jgi:hypothetical protein
VFRQVLCIFLSLLTKLQLMSLTSQRTDPWRWDCSCPGFLLCNIALSIRNRLQTTVSALCIQNQSLALQLTCKQQGPMLGGEGGVGRRGQDSGSKAHILDQHPASHLYKREREKRMLSASQLLQQASSLGEKWVISLGLTDF